MKQYQTLNHLWWDTLKQIIKQGNELNSRVGNTKEILGFQATLLDPTKNILLEFPERKFSLSYACAEMLWYLSGTFKIDMIEAYAPSYKNFAEQGIAYGAYGGRWEKNPGFAYENSIFFHPNGKNQLEALIHLLKEKPNTRQAIITMWDSGDLLHAIIGDHKDLPCTIALHFMIREKKLYLIATMRSNDAWLGLPYDVFCFTTLQRIIAEELNLELGSYIHQAGSEHIYENNFEKVNKILENCWGEYPIKDFLVYHPIQSLNYKIEQALNFEEWIRKTPEEKCSSTILSNINLLNLDSTFSDLVMGTATRWIDIKPANFHNPYFAEWTQQFNERK